MVVQALAAEAVCGVQVATGTLLVLSGVGQVVVVQLLLSEALEGVQLVTPTLVVTFGEGQVRVT